MSSLYLLLRPVSSRGRVECLELRGVHVSVGHLHDCSLVGQLLMSGLGVIHLIAFGFGCITLDCGVLRTLEVLLMLDLFQLVYKQSDLGFGLLGR